MLAVERRPADVFFAWLDDLWESQRSSTVSLSVVTYECFSRHVLTEIFRGLTNAVYRTPNVVFGEWHGINVIVRLA